MQLPNSYPFTGGSNFPLDLDRNVGIYVARLFAALPKASCAKNGNLIPEEVMDAFTSFATDSTARWRSFYPRSFRSFIPLKSSFLRPPLVPINFTVRNFQVKIADTSFEKKSAYRLRFEVFQKEFAKNPLMFGLDKDRFDDIADLLIIKDITTSQVVGTYRFICSEVSDRFYSATEFNLDRFLATKDTKVELSRACIHKDYRKGLVITLLWRGMYEYLRGVDAKYLFGLSSVTNVNPAQVLGLIQHFRQIEVLDDRFGILPRRKYDQSANILKGLNDASLSESEVKDLIPPLLRGYLNGGAKLTTVPAYDNAFSCYDFLTILAASDLKASHIRKLGNHL